MGLQFILGRAGAGKTKHCLDAVLDELNHCPEGSPLIILVPEQATFQVERTLAAAAQSNGFVRAYVYGFRRLAYRVLSETGGGARPRITDMGKRLALRRLLSENKDSLKILARAARQRGFAETLASAIWEFKTYRVTPDVLSKKLEGMDAGVLGDKLHDLALLYQKFEEFLAGRYIDPEDSLNLLAAKIPQSTLLRGARVWVDGFQWFTPQEFAVIEAIMASAADVNISLCLTEPDHREHQTETSLFHRQWQTYQQLTEAAVRLGQQPIVTELAPGTRFRKTPVLAHAESYFFRPGIRRWEGPNGNVMIVEAANRRAEAEGIARDIIRLCRDEGYRWRDIAVLMPDSDSYSELLETVLADYDVPCFSDRRRPAVHHPLSELIRSALEVASGNWTYDPLFRCFKTDLFPLTRQEIDVLENYVLEFGIRGSRWTSNLPWNFVRRLSLEEDSETTEREHQFLEDINRLRNIAASPLAELGAAIAAASTMTDLASAVYNFLSGLQVPDRLEEWAHLADETGNLDEAREHRQLWDAVVAMLDQLVETCGEQPAHFDDFAAMVNEGLEGMALSLIPPGLDYVTLSSLERTQFIEARAVYLPGINDGVLPKRVRDDGLFNETERRLLAQHQIELAPGADHAAFQEQFLVYTALTRATDYLWTSFALADEEGGSLQPSLVITRLRQLVGIDKLRLLTVEPEQDAEQYLAHPRQSLAAMAAAFRQLQKGICPDQLWWDVYNWALGTEAVRPLLSRLTASLFYNNDEAGLPSNIARKLYFREGKLRGSITRFESYQACPFQYFARYGLKLEERAEAKLRALDFGQFLHAVLRQFGERIHDKKNWGWLKPEEITNICREIITELAPKLQNEILLSSKQHQHLQTRLEKTAVRAIVRLAEYDSVTDFKPLKFEQSFGRGEGGWPALTMTLADGSQLELSGQIDRLDGAVHDGKVHLLIIDYKTGQAKPDLEALYYGLKLQLMTYLLVACLYAAEDLTAETAPAGALYYFLKNPRVTGPRHLSTEEIKREVDKNFKMPGWVLKDPAVVEKLDQTIDDWSRYITIGMSAKTKNIRKDAKSAKTAGELELLMNHVQRKLMETAEQIGSGQVAIAPYKHNKQTPCLFCAYKPVCQMDSQIPGNTYRLLERLKDDEILRRLSDEKGGEDYGVDA